VNRCLYKLFLFTILILSSSYLHAQNHFTELSFYSNNLNSKDAIEVFTKEINKSLNTSTPKAEKIAQLFLEYATSKQDSNLILNAYFQMGSVYYQTSKFDSSLVYINLAKTLAQKRGDKQILSEVYLTLGAINLAANNNDVANQNFNKSYNLASEAQDKVIMAKALNNLSVVSGKVGEYENALNYLKRALDLKIAYGKKTDRISTLLNIGDNYAKLRNYEKAKEYYVIAEKIAVDYKANIKLARIWLAVAILEIELNNFSEAERYFEKSIQMSEDLNDYGQLALTTKSYSEYWMQVSQWEKAKVHLNQILVDNEYFKDSRLMAKVYYDLGRVEYEQQHYSKSEEWFKKAINVGVYPLDKTMANTYLYLSKIGYAKKNYRTGYDYLVLSNHINDSLDSYVNFNKLQELQVKYNATNDKKHIDNLIELTELKEKERKQSTMYLWISIVVFLLTLVVAIALAFQVVQKRKKSKELETQIKENTKKTQDLIKANERAEEGLRVKSEFIAMVSHEIRTPMNAIIGMSSLLWDTDLSDNQKNYLNNITISSNNLLILLNDILDFSRVESGKVSILIQQANLKKEFVHIVDMFTPLAAEKGLEFIVDIDQNIPEVVYVDAPRLRQVIVNLLSNAIKFTHQGFVKLRIEITKKEPTLNGEKISFRFSVSDSGIGVPKEKQGEIFSSFKQLDSKVSRKYSGVGLGLSISQGILGMMGSNINLESEFAKGNGKDKICDSKKR